MFSAESFGPCVALVIGHVPRSHDELIGNIGCTSKRSEDLPHLCVWICGHCLVSNSQWPYAVLVEEVIPSCVVALQISRELRDSMAIIVDGGLGRCPLALGAIGSHMPEPTLLSLQQ